MANTLRFKRGLVAGIPTGVAGEPLFTTDTFDLYIGNGTTNTRFQKYIASGTTLQYLRGDGSLATFPTNIVTGTGVSGQVAYWSGTTTQTGSNNLFWDATNNRLGIGTNAPRTRVGIELSGATAPSTVVNTTGFDNTYTTFGNVDLVSGSQFAIGVSQTGTTGTYLISAAPTSEWTDISYYGRNNLFFSSGTERMRLTANGRLLLGTTTEGTQRLQVAGDVKFDADAATNGFYWDNTNKRLGIGLSNQEATLQVGTKLGSGANVYSFSGYRFGVENGTSRFIGGEVTGNNQTTTAIDIVLGGSAAWNNSTTRLTFSGFDRGNAFNSGTLGSIGIFKGGGLNTLGDGNLVFGTTPSGSSTPTERMRIDANGSVGIGTTVLTAYNLHIGKNITGSFPFAVWQDGTVQSTATNIINGFQNSLRTQAAVFTISEYNHFSVEQYALGAGSVVTSQKGFNVDNTMTGATNNYGFYGNIASGTGRWNLYMNGTAANYLAGELYVGGTTGYGASITSYGSAIRSGGIGIRNSAGTVAGGFFTYAAGSGSGSTDIIVEATGFMLFSAGGSERMKLYSATGNFAIGSTASDSGEKLQVTGTMKVTGASTFNSNLGIGTTPSYRLHVLSAGTDIAAFSNTTGNSLILFTNAQTSADLIYRFRQNNGGGNFYDLRHYGTANTFAIDYNGTSALTIASTGAATFSSSVTAASLVVDTTTLVVDATNDRVGVGTATPTAKLDVIQSGGTAGISVSGGTNPQMRATDGTITAKVQAITGVAAYIGTESNHQLRLITNNSPRLTIDTTGAATFTSSIAAGGNLLLGASASTIGAMNLILTGTTPVASRLTFGTDGTGYSFAIGKNQAGTVTDLLKIADSGLATFTDNARFSNLKGCIFVQTGGTLLGSIAMDSSNQITIDNNGFFGLSVGSNYTMTGGNLGIGHNGFGTSATRTLSILSGTAPSTSPADSFQMYSNDVVAGNAAPHFRTENGAVIKLYQETTAVGNSIISLGGGSAVLDDTTFDGYTLRQIVKALRNQGILA